MSDSSEESEREEITVRKIDNEPYDKVYRLIMMKI